MYLYIYKKKQKNNSTSKLDASKKHYVSFQIKQQKKTQQNKLKYSILTEDKISEICPQLKE